MAKGKPARQTRRSNRRMAAALGGAIGLALTAMAYHFAMQLERQTLERQFQDLAEARVIAIERVLEGHLQNFYNVSEFFDASEHVTREEFRSATKRIIRRLPSIQALEWVPRVRHEELADYQQSAHQDGLQFAVTQRATDGRLQAAPRRPEYYPVFYVEPYEGNERALGFDLGSDTVRRLALTNALKSGQPHATARITLVQEPSDQYACLVFLPRYRHTGSDAPQDRTARVEELEGFVLGVMRMGDLMEVAVGRRSFDPLHLELRDLSAPPGQRSMATLGSARPVHGRAGVLLKRSHLLDFAGRRWEVRVRPTGAFFAGRSSANPAFVLIIGLLLTALLAAYLVQLERQSRSMTQRNLALSTAAALRRRLTESVLRAQDEERGRLARELHDETGQSMTSLIAGLGTLEALASEPQQAERIKELRRVAEQTLDDLGRLARGLHPAMLDTLGLQAAVEQLAKQAGTTQGVKVELDLRGIEGRRLGSDVEVTLYRILQEALTNSIRHGDAGHILVRLRRRAKGVEMTLQDDGSGFDLDEATGQPSASDGLGILAMGERASLLGGTLSIRSRPGEGTKIVVQVPLEVR